MPSIFTTCKNIHYLNYMHTLILYLLCHPVAVSCWWQSWPSPMKSVPISWSQWLEMWQQWFYNFRGATLFCNILSNIKHPWRLFPSDLWVICSLCNDSELPVRVDDLVRWDYCCSGRKWHLERDPWARKPFNTPELTVTELECLSGCV